MSSEQRNLTVGALVGNPSALSMPPTSVDAVFQSSLSAHRAGRIKDAETGYRRVLYANGEHVEARFLLGTIEDSKGDLVQAEAAYRYTLALKPDFAPALLSLGTLLARNKCFVEAETVIRRALGLKPDFPAAYVNLGNVLSETKHFAEAEAAYRRALKLKPDSVDAHINLGRLLKMTKQFTEAEAIYRSVLKVKPDLYVAHVDLGKLFAESKRFEEADAAYCQALNLGPEDAEVYFDYGDLLAKTRRFDAAEDAFHRAIELRPDLAEARFGLAELLRERGHFVDAQCAYRHALELKPDFAEAYSGLGDLFSQIRQYADAEAAFRRALELKPDLLQAKFCLAVLLLKLGRYAEGWAHYESRHAPFAGEETAALARSLPFPEWQGEQLAKRSIVILADEGYGDQIQCIRYARLLKRSRASRVTVCCPSALTALFQSVEGIDVVTANRNTIPLHDYWIRPLSMPQHFGTTVETIPARVPYVFPLRERVERWRKRLPPGKLRIGLVWKGNKANGNDANRSLPGLSVLSPLWSVPGVTFVSLQKGQDEDDAKSSPSAQPLTAIGHDIQDFADTAAIVSQLDLIICVDTSVAHVAGALAKPCWVMLPFFRTDWRWMTDRSDSPWYPKGMRLFRQSTFGDWTDVVGEVTSALRSWALARVLDPTETSGPTLHPLP